MCDSNTGLRHPVVEIAFAAIAFAVGYLSYLHNFNEWAIATCVSITIIPYLFSANIGRLTTLLGLLLPIYTVSRSPSLIWDGIRFVIVIALLLRTLRHGLFVSTPAIFLVIIGSTFFVLSLAKGDFEGIQLSFVILYGAAVSAAVVTQHRTRFLSAFVLGATLSALAVIIESMTGVGLGSGYQGTTGFIGLGNVSTQTGPVLVLAIAVLSLGFTNLSYWVQLVSLSVLVMGVTMAGSRNGLGALVILGVSLIFTQRVRVGLRVLLVSSLVLAIAVGYALRWASVERFQVNGVVSSERSGGFLKSVTFFLSSPWTGIQASTADAAYVHNLYSYWAAVFGILGIVGLIAIIWSLWRAGLPWPVLLLIIFVSAFETAGLLVAGASLSVLVTMALASNQRELVRFVEREKRPSHAISEPTLPLQPSPRSNSLRLLRMPAVD